MVRKEVIISNLQRERPMFLQIGFVVVFLLCMGTQKIYAQKIKSDTTMQEEYIFGIGQAEESPEFTGGEVARVQFLMDNLRYPMEAKEKKLQGRVAVYFVVEKDGSLTNFEVVKSVHPVLDEEALRVVNLMPKWKPGKVRGEAVRVQFQIPINFTLVDSKPKKEILKKKRMK